MTKVTQIRSLLHICCCFVTHVNPFFRPVKLLTKITQKMFSETFKHTYNYYQAKMAKFFNREVLIGRFQEHTLN